MNQIQKQKIARLERRLYILKYAKDYMLEVTHSRGICSCIVVASENGFSEQHTRKDLLFEQSILRGWIAEMLGVHNVYLSDWLINCKKVDPADIRNNIPKLRNTRIAWLDWMIAGFESDLQKARGTKCDSLPK